MSDRPDPDYEELGRVLEKAVTSKPPKYPQTELGWALLAKEIVEAASRPPKKSDGELLYESVWGTDGSECLLASQSTWEKRAAEFRRKLAERDGA